MTKASPASFVRSTIEESRKVIWPTRDIVIRHTIMVIISIAIGVLVFAGIDFALQKLVLVAIQ